MTTASDTPGTDAGSTSSSSMTLPADAVAAGLWQPHYARREARMRASEIRELLKLLERPEVISFAGGIPDSALLPADAAAEAYAAVFSDPGTARAGLQYSTSEGFALLRRWVAEHMARLGVPCGENNVLITNGSQQALEFLGKLFVTPGDTILTEAPTYLGALQAFSATEPNYDACLGEGSNATADACRERAAAAGGGVAMAYLVPDFANPTGLTMSADARLRHIELARSLNVPLIEDAAYTELRYGGVPVPAMMALDIAACGSIEQSCVIYCGTFSKVICPGLRVGWVVAAEPIIQKLVLIKQAADLNASLINQMVMFKLASSRFEASRTEAIEMYRERRDAMLAALKTHFTGKAKWSEPDGGLFVWVTLGDGIDSARLLQVALAEQNVAFVPGAGFYSDDGGRNKLRLSFSQNPPERIAEGVRRLAKAFEAHAAER